MNAEAASDGTSKQEHDLRHATVVKAPCRPTKSRSNHQRCRQRLSSRHYSNSRQLKCRSTAGGRAFATDAWPVRKFRTVSRALWQALLNASCPDSSLSAPCTADLTSWPPLASRAVGALLSTMTNIVNFRGPSSDKTRNQNARASALLARLAHGLGQIGQRQLKNREDIQHALFFIAISKEHLRHFISQIKNEESRVRLSAEIDSIEQLLKDIGRKAAAL